MSGTFDFLAGSLALENKPFHMQVAELIKNKFRHCEGYIGYKLATLGRASDSDVPDFIIITKEHGIILVDMVESKVSRADEVQGNEVWHYEHGGSSVARNFIVELYEEEVKSRLKNDAIFYNRRKKTCTVPITSAVIFCKNNNSEIGDFYQEYADYESSAIEYGEIENWLDSVEEKFNCDSKVLGRIFSLLEGTFIYENKKILDEEPPLNTMNDYIKKSLNITFNQDHSQRIASMQLTPGPQRIRGLAGTGKTIVLSLKAAITHKKFPDYKILYLFNTQSLYQNVQSSIARYYTLEAKKAPDFESNLNVFHAWGGRQKPGLYSHICQQYGLTPLTLGDVRGASDALAVIYAELLKKIGSDIKPEYDLILIDEAQDFPKELFEVVFKLAKGKVREKRIVWAYDEFQSLKDTQIKGPSELFGMAKDGTPNMSDDVLDGFYPGDIKKDIVLSNCYRTPRPALMTAHGVALGLYTNKPNEMFYNHDEWKAIGYKVLNPQTKIIAKGNDVQIERPNENSLNLLEGIMTEQGKRALNLIQTKMENDREGQYEYIANNIKRLIDEENVSPEEIVVINLKSSSNKDEMLRIQFILNNYGIHSVIPGYVESSDVFKPKGFVTITTPFRAKGNEANIVFILNSQLVVNDFSLRMRNAFFVAVTRTRGWCYIVGYGEKMQMLVDEISGIKRDFPIFNFICPDPDDVKARKSYLHKSDSEINEMQRVLDLVNNNEELRRLLQEQLIDKKGD